MTEAHQLLRQVKLNSCWIDQFDHGTVVTFEDGATGFMSNFADDVRLGAADLVGLKHDIPTYSFEHEVLHEFLAEKLWGKPSPILWNSAHKRKGNIVGGYYEEYLVHKFHCYLRGTSDLALEPEWPEWKSEALALLNGDSYVGAQ